MRSNNSQPIGKNLCNLGTSLLAGALVPAAIAQDDDSNNLGSGIVSDVLDGSGNADSENDRDATNTAAAEDSNQDETTVYTENKRVMVMMEEDEEKEEVSTTLDNFLSNA